MTTHTDQPASHEERARRLLATKPEPAALEEIAALVRERPQDAALRLIACEAYATQGLLSDAADHVAAVVAREPEHREANRKLAQLLSELGDAPGAIRAWRRVVTGTREEDAEAVTALAIALTEVGQHGAAIELLTKLSQRNPQDASAKARLGVALGVAGRDDEALSVLAQALALEPDSAQAHVGVGLIQHKRGQWSEAAEAFRRAERLAPASATSSFNLGLALERLGDRAGARRALLRAAALEPDDEEIQGALESLIAQPPASALNGPSSRDGASIHGDLESFELFNVLEFLRMQRKTGSLVISAPAGVGVLRLEQGMLIGGSAPRVERLGELLVRRGLILRRDLDLALSRQKELYPELGAAVDRDAPTLGVVLLKDHLLEESQLTDVLFHMIVLVIGQINQWQKGAFAFHPAEDMGFPIRFNVQNVVLELLRTEDERMHYGAETAR